MGKQLGQLIDNLSLVNIQQWHEEDKSRSDNNRQVATAKRKIDELNQKRNDLIETIDELFSSE